MIGKISNNFIERGKDPEIVDINDFYIDSFTEFYPFCKKLFYFSNYKDFISSVQE